MTEGMAALLIWEACAVLFAGIGIYCFLAKKPVGFFANAKPPEMRDVRAYTGQSAGCGWYLPWYLPCWASRCCGRIPRWCCWGLSV